ncbi:MAG: hypothetical protein ACR2L2_08090 [Acidobacteriota bacterium]
MNSSSKQKILKTAEKHVVSGKFASAVAEYLKIVKEDADDVIILNTIGDLLTRLNKHTDANAHFVRVAELYLKNGFTLKAIAMYKKITRLIPDDERIHETLAQLYLKQGLVAEAKQHFKTIADKHLRSGREPDAMVVYQKITEFDKKDAEILALLANYHSKESPSVARDYYLLAGRAALDRDLIGPAESHFREALRIDPKNLDVLRGYLDAATRNHHAAEAVALFENLYRESPDEALLADFLADAYQGAGQLKNAEKILLELFEKDPAYFSRLLDLAEQLHPTDRAAALTVIEHVLPTAAARRDSERVRSVIEAILEREPTEVRALHLMADLYLKLNESDLYLQIQEQLLALHEGQRDWSQALKAAERLLRQDPASTLYREKHIEIFEHLFPDRPYLAPFEEAPSKPVEVVEEPVELEEESFRLEEEEHASGLTLETLTTEGQEQDDVPAFEFFAQESAESEDQTLVEMPEEDLSRLLADGGGAAPAAATESTLEESLQEIDFYVGMGLRDDAARIVQSLLPRYPDNPELKQRASELQQPVFESAETQRAIAEVEVLPEQEVLASLDLQIDRAIDALFDFGPASGSQEEVGEAPYQYNRTSAGAAAPDPSGAVENMFKAHYDLGFAYKEMGLLEDAEGEFARAFENATGRTPAKEVGMCCSMLAHCKLEQGHPREALQWCERGLEKSSTGDFQYKALKYEMGRAYETLGRLDDARRCFEELHGLDADYRDVAAKLGG